ncbi:MAG: FkbM family methyltransferase [Thermodesulfobacteriota bacterium]
MIKYKLLKYLKKPEYLLRPRQIIHRLRIAFSKSKFEEISEVTLPWGLTIKVHPNESIGLTIFKSGVFDLAVSEVLWRLIDEGDTAIDVGANIGCMTSIMLMRVGECGKVFAFEPNPMVYREFTENINIWLEEISTQQISTMQIALSNQVGQGRLIVPKRFNQNRGISYVKFSNEGIIKHSEEDALYEYNVQLERLDNIVNAHVGAMKIDVEHHELCVLEGSEKLLHAGYIRDIVYEDLEEYPSVLSDFLEKRGYTIFKIDKGIFSPIVQKAKEGIVHKSFDSPSYIASKNPERIIIRFKPKGWMCLKRAS